jgi:hypothetical protein
MTRARFILGLLAVSGLVALACGGAGFESQTKVNTVRMFGVQADKPYALPGETVTLTALTTDGRRDKPRPMKLFWIPLVCANPREDLYYACFIPRSDGGTSFAPPFADAGGAAPPAGGAIDAGSGNILDRIPRDVDLGGFLPQGDSFSFQMPEGIIQERVGSVPYGLAIIFNIACAGQVRYVGRAGDAPQQVPIQCTDEDGKPLGPDDYVLGINRVYSYADRTNTNPVIDGLTLDGTPVDLDAGLVLDHCVGKRRADCKEWKIDVKVPESSWEANPDPGGPANQREQIWVAYYSNVGDLRDSARLLYDSTKGKSPDSETKYRAPYNAIDGTMWFVVHDSRAGAAFVTVPVHVK